jgi:Lon protease-like protein
MASIEVPLFPLNTVVFPGGLLPLRIFEPRYLSMVSDCMRNDTGFGVCLIKDGRETGTPGEICRTGTLCRIVDWERLPDSLLGITARGECKLRVVASRVAPNNLLLGQVEFTVEEVESPLPPEFKPLSRLLERILTALGPPYSDLPGACDQAGWVGARLIELLPLALPIKQRLLETDDVHARLLGLREVMLAMQHPQS